MAQTTPSMSNYWNPGQLAFFIRASTEGSAALVPAPALGGDQVTRGLAWHGRRAAAAAPVGHGAFRARPGRGGQGPPAQVLRPRRRPAWGTRERSRLLSQHFSGLSDTQGSAREASSTPKLKASGRTS